MYINTSKKGLKFRFDGNKILFITDGNTNEFKIGIFIADTLRMSRPLDNKVEVRYQLKRIDE
jgi:hypothetical protein